MRGLGRGVLKASQVILILKNQKTKADKQDAKQWEGNLGMPELANKIQDTQSNLKFRFNTH